jgi:hypothetical protein
MDCAVLLVLMPTVIYVLARSRSELYWKIYDVVLITGRKCRAFQYFYARILVIVH